VLIGIKRECDMRFAYANKSKLVRSPLNLMGNVGTVTIQIRKHCSQQNGAFCDLDFDRTGSS